MAIIIQYIQVQGFNSQTGVRSDITEKNWNRNNLTGHTRYTLVSRDFKRIYSLYKQKKERDLYLVNQHLKFSYWSLIRLQTDPSADDIHPNQQNLILHIEQIGLPAWFIMWKTDNFLFCFRGYAYKMDDSFMSVLYWMIFEFNVWRKD